MSFENVKDKNVVLVVNTETGEVVSKVHTKEKFAPLPLVFTEKGKYVGVDVKYPSECLCAEQYFDAVCQLDGLATNKVKVNTEMVLDNVAEGLWSVGDVKMIKFLSLNVVAHNRVFTTTKEIEESLNMKASNVSRWFKNNTGICKIVKKRGTLILDINPVLMYKGSEEWRSYHLSVWCSQIPYIK